MPERGLRPAQQRERTLRLDARGGFMKGFGLQGEGKTAQRGGGIGTESHARRKGTEMVAAWK